MKSILLLSAATLLLFSCKEQPSASTSAPAAPSTNQLKGTWRLVSGTTITKGVSTFTDYTRETRMIKIINDTHFAFVKHDVNSPKDSSNHFGAGGGRYTLNGNEYTEHLDYFSDKNWEGHAFTFTVSFDKDTLIQKGIEKVEKENVDREIIEKYVKEK
ncbi:MAG TPA: hypothetical protein VM802_23725 [Chitinophaga sp.]|uniref:hypothetical protein n=1 Tax=Chitinophaga sp. TaxID=1869181 RepID=UPI002C700A57|nr:hypothetical protein [Chitinophaga sp.]HVI47898.1 hypothetical protein [Chitinophaga sp.]